MYPKSCSTNISPGKKAKPQSARVSIGETSKKLNNNFTEYTGRKKVSTPQINVSTPSTRRLSKNNKSVFRDELYYKINWISNQKFFTFM